MEHPELHTRLESTTFPDLEKHDGRLRKRGLRAGLRRSSSASSTSAPSPSTGSTKFWCLVGENPDLNLDFEVRLWGSYLGEVLRRRYAGTWEMTAYPGELPNGTGQANGSVAVPAVEVRGSRLFPLLKVYRRLTIGEEDDLSTFFNLVTERLGNPARVN